LKILKPRDFVKSRALPVATGARGKSRGGTIAQEKPAGWHDSRHKAVKNGGQQVQARVEVPGCPVSQHE